MANLSGEYLVGEDLDDIYFLLESGFLDDDDGFNKAFDTAVSEVSTDQETAAVYSCKECSKACKSKRDLSRHVNAKHPTTDVGNDVSEKVDPVVKKLHPQELQKIVKECAVIVGTDECLPESCRNRFCESSFSFSENDAYELWYKLKPIVSDFDGDAERFYSQFYGLLVDNLLSQIFDCTTDANVILTEVGNHILLHLSSKDTKTVPAVKPSSITDKELKCLQYVAGFVLHKLHSKFKFAKKWSSSFNRPCIAILQACKTDFDASQTLVNVRDRGGLWRVSEKMQEVFIQCEKIFRSKTADHLSSFSCEKMVFEMLKDCTVMSKYHSICYGIDPKVNKEISMNLLEHILSLFVKVRVFSYAKDIREKHKVTNKKSKKRSLRTEIKQASSSLEHGHWFSNYYQI